MITKCDHYHNFTEVETNLYGDAIYSYYLDGDTPEDIQFSVYVCDDDGQAHVEVSVNDWDDAEKIFNVLALTR